MEGATTLGNPPQDSPSKSSQVSPGRKLPRKSAPKYSSCLLYNTAAAKEKMAGLTIATCNPSFEGDSVRTVEEMVPIPVPVSDNEKREFFVSEKMSCNFCQAEFTHRNEQKHHYRSDWHRFNLKQRIKGLNSVSEEAFESISGNISSLSGSDTDSDATDTESDSVPRSKPISLPARMRQSLYSGSESESESGSCVENASARKYPKVYMRNSSGELISVYRCVLYHKKSPPETQTDLTNVATSLADHMTWAVFMAGGGHFAGAVFEKDKILQHKTFHRYVVRAKRGSAQSSRDSQGGAPKSGGASLRRYNEAALMQDIQDLVASWDELMKKCDLIFLRAPSFNRQIFFGGKNPPLHKNDTRIRLIPFPTRRATYKEVRRVHEMLASIECYGEEDDIREFVPMSPRRQFSLDSGHLEPITDSEKSPSPKKKMAKSKSRLSPLAKSSSEGDQSNAAAVKPPSLPVLDSILRERRQSTSSVGSSASDVDLVELNQEISTLSLKLFEATRKPRKKKQKKKKSDVPLKHQLEPESNVLEEEKYHLKNSLYTACKIGDVESLKNLLAIFHQPTTDQSPAEIGVEEMSVANQNTAESSSASSLHMLDNSTNQNADLPTTFANPEEPLVPANQSNDNILDDLTNKNIMPEDTDNKNTEDNHSNLKNTENLNDNRSCKPEEDKIKKSPSPCHLSGAQKSALKTGVIMELPSPIVTQDILNEPIGDSCMTLLHIAAKEGHKTVIGLLLGAGSDPSIKDRFSQTPYTSGKSKEVRNEFRRFMAKFPDKYDYDKAEIPGPLTEEMEQERKQKEAERKRLQKKAKLERLKDQKAEEAKQRTEELEKKRFMALSDREKRALAAERRQVQTAVTSGVTVPVFVRCFHCAADMTGNVPFEYSDFKFCSTKCLKEHRLKNTVKKT